MYGLINKALKSMIQDNYGQDTWEKVLLRSGVAEDAFVSMQRYDDKITYDLVAAASDVLELPAETCLDAFGHYWVSAIAAKSYRLLLDVTGDNMLQFLSNINNLHDRITSTFIGYTPPHFDLDFEENRINLVYISTRQGLTPFVLGILRGLSERFNQPIEIGEVEYLPNTGGEKSMIPIQLIAQ